VVDDDLDILELVRELLADEGYDVSEATNGREAVRAVYDARPDLVILDVAMPQLDGWQTLERIRDMSDVPVVMLTARAAEDDTVPFSVRELLARVEALLRDGRAADVPAAYGDGLVAVDFAEPSVTVGGREVALTPLEFRLLSAFVRHPDHTLSVDRLLRLAWRDASAVTRDQVKLYVGYLRRKLTAAGAPGDLIETVRGFGYRYRPPQG
jgi:DNA-binding response OmpR family regulator